MMLVDSRDLAVRGGDLHAADAACWELSTHFDVSLAEARLAMLQQASNTLEGQEAYASFVTLALHTVDDALLCDDFTPVDEVMQLAGGALRDAQSPDLGKALAVREAQLTLQQAEYKKVASEIAMLAAHPDDPGANLAVGKYICFIRGDWPTGLPMLVKGSDAHLKELAKLDVSNPEDPDEQSSLGDRWYVFGNSPAVKRDQVRLRAYYWYEKAQNGLSGATARRTAARIEELEPLVTRRGVSQQIWSAIAKALQRHTYANSDIVGGSGAPTNIEDIPQAGALLIGLYVGGDTFSNYPTVGYFQGIFLTASGNEVLGKPIGNLKGQPVLLKAKPGYAVGAIQARGGAGMDALTLTFMKIKGGHLDPSTAYRSDKVGGNGGQETDLDGKGLPIIGLQGKAGDRKWIGFGVVYLAPAGGEKN
jgi:hypothetical protein